MTDKDATAIVGDFIDAMDCLWDYVESAAPEPLTVATPISRIKIKGITYQMQLILTSDPEGFVPKGNIGVVVPKLS